MLAAARLPHGGDLLRQYPHQLSGGMAQRGADRHRVFQQPAARYRRRADHRARRHHAPANSSPDRRDAARTRDRGHLHHPRSAPRRTIVRSGGRDVCRPRRRKRPGACDPVEARASLYAVLAACQSDHAPRAARALCDAGSDAELAAIAGHDRLSLRTALPARCGRLPPRRAADSYCRRRACRRLYPHRRDGEHCDRRSDGSASARFPSASVLQVEALEKLRHRQRILFRRAQHESRP